MTCLPSQKDAITVTERYGLTWPFRLSSHQSNNHSDIRERQIDVISLVDPAALPSVPSRPRSAGLTSMSDSWASISRMPCEVLGRIFYWLQSCEHGCYGWLRATRVCRLWRVVFLQHPRLWAQITGARGLGPEGTRAMLSRAKMAPIQICFGIDDDDTVDVLLDYIPQHMSQIQNLELAHPRFADLLKKLTQPAPLLEEFSLCAPYGDKPMTLPLTLFGGDAPRLRRLKTEHLVVDWTLPILKNLTSLSVDANDVDVPLLLEFLENMPQLEHLGIMAAHPRLDGIKAAGERQVPLPHLVSMRLEMFLPQTLMLVNTLEIPPRTSIDITTEFFFATLPHAAHLNLFSFFFAHCTRRGPLSYLSFYKRSSQGLDVDIESYGTGHTPSTGNHKLSIKWPERFYAPAKLIETMVINVPQTCLLHLDRIMFFQFNWDDVFSPMDFTRMLLFTGFSNLVAIQIPLMYLASFAEALGMQSRLSIHAITPPPPTVYKERSMYCLPSLQVINVITPPIPDYRGPEFAQHIIDHAKPPSHLPALFFNVLTERRERGMFLHTIEFLPALGDPSPDPSVWYEFLRPTLEDMVHLVGPDSDEYICGPSSTELPRTNYVDCSFGAYAL
ncbi:hypothetical protein EVG20_g6690 [Dentipellis fragilis]|uniref:Uncharacterized protein n=1 Tax=Dentipellis fragilis TaxID=205917 RepID=A0A4Y9YNA6_9AGAM|nr:hypothetical protein EVG20_g6690 [Dentipellis fragilis]